MASALHQGHLIVSRAYYNAESKLWLPETTVSWTTDGHYHYHTLKATGAFDTEKEAIDSGFLLARTWIDKKL
jgi:hypothetical protein